MTNSSPITITGSAVDGTTIEIVGPIQTIMVPVKGGAFSANVALEANSLNHLYLTTIGACGARSATIETEVTHDGQPPNLFIDFPADGAEITTASTDVAGRVGDLLSGFMGLTVNLMINGDAKNPVPAIVDVGIGTNGTFFAAAVPLVEGPNTIEATATDQLGNSQTKQITLSRVAIPPNTPQLQVVSGNGQSGVIHSELPDPIVVRMLQADGTTPFANKIATFKVTRSDGRLAAPPGGDCVLVNPMMLQCRTDANGEAAALWMLGGDAGCGNNRVGVTSTSVLGTTAFCASATAAPPAQINIGSGNNRRVEVGGVAPEELRAWVSDGCNGVAGVPVTFTVVQGSGKVIDPLSGSLLDQVTVPTAVTGHAEVSFTLGPDPGNNAVEATFPANPGSPATFVAYGVQRDLLQPTSFTGLVLDNASQPIEGAKCTLVVGGSALFRFTDAAGQFRFDNVPAAGQADLVVDGRAAVAIGGQPIVPCQDAGGGSLPNPCLLPFLHYEPVLVPNAVNSLPTPVLLPKLDPTNRFPYRGTQDDELTVEGMDGLKMTVAAGTRVVLPNGSCVDPADPACTGDPACNAEFGGPCVTLSLNQVHHDDVPMPMPDGAAPPFAWTLQPAGATFDPPVKVQYPNMSFLPPGSIAYFLSFNHDTMRFEIVAHGHVTDDGSCIESDPGAGISTAGWGCNCPPYAVAGNCNKCKPPMSCCGGVPYNPNTHGCCANRAVFQLGTHACCFGPNYPAGSRVYDRNEQCCVLRPPYLAGLLIPIHPIRRIDYDSGCPNLVPTKHSTQAMPGPGGTWNFEYDGCSAPGVLNASGVCSQESVPGPACSIFNPLCDFGVCGPYNLCGCCGPGALCAFSANCGGTGTCIPFNKDNPTGASDTYFSGAIPGAPIHQVPSPYLACDPHDACYQTCWTPEWGDPDDARLACDTNWWAGMQVVCNASSHGPLVIEACLDWADVYYGFVRAAGGFFAFFPHQLEVCDCCDYP